MSSKINYIKPFLEKDLDNIYEVEPGRPGVCLIINNVDFGRPENYRHGSNNNFQCFKNIFEDFNFKVIDRENQTVEQMTNEIENAVSAESMDNRSSFVLIILSHGIESGICGIDSLLTGKCLGFKEIVEILGNNKCKTLRHKPKMCFFQACNGRKESRLQEDSCWDLGKQISKRKKHRLPPISDVLLSFAAQDEYATERHRIQGGIYARHLISVLQEHARTCDLEQMLKFVEIKVREDEIIKKAKPHLCLSTSLKLIGWSKSFYFYPIHQGSFLSQDSMLKRANETLRRNSIKATSRPGIEVSSAGKLLVLGGSQHPECLSLDGEMWIQTTDTGLTGHHQGVLCSKGQIFVFDQDCISTWNPSDGKVVQVPKGIFPEPRPLYAYGVVGENIYIMGGRLSGMDTDQCYIFNTTKGKRSPWEKISDMSRKTSGRTAVVLRDKIYVTPGAKNEEIDTLDVLNPQSRAWNENIGRPMNYPRCGHGMATCGTHIWIFGGKSNGSVCKFVERFHFGTGEWEVMPPMKTARENLSVTYYQGEFYAIGGRDGKGKDLNVVEIFDLAGHWRRGPKLNTPRNGHTSTVLPLTSTN